MIVNILTNHAQNNGRVLVFGGEQLRPNIHIDDMVDFYCHLLDAPAEKIQGQSFNIGTDNHSVNNLAEIVRKCFSKEITLRVEPTDDLRSYHISSQKAEKVLGFTTKKTIFHAVQDLVEKFESGLIPNSLEDEKYFNVKRMKNYKFE